MTKSGLYSRHRRHFLVITGGGAFTLFLESLVSPPARAASSAIVTGKALSAVNAYRKANGRDALVADAALGRAARDHSTAMAKSGKLNHKQFRSRLRKYKIRGAAAENVASGQPD
ncbi:MAG: CAP domain-containing protein, partial [Pseudomonadota bacterium]